MFGVSYMEYKYDLAVIGEYYDLYSSTLGRLANDLTRFGKESTLIYLLTKGSVLAGTLTKASGLTSGRTANILKNLEKKGLITRTRGDKDQRQVIVSLTENGKSYIRERLNETFDKIVKFHEFLGEEDTLALKRLLIRSQDFLNITEEK